jgi:uncharacterized membrane protein
MSKKLLPELQLTNTLIFSPIVIIVLTQLLPSNAVLGILSMLTICTFPGYALLYRFKLHRSNIFQDLFFSVLLSILVLQSVYTAYSIFCYGLGFKHSLTSAQVFLIATIILLMSSLTLRKNIDVLEGIKLIQGILIKVENIKIFFYLIPLVLPFISLIAVTRLNLRNDSKTTWIFLYACIAILLILSTGRALKVSIGMHYLIFYCTVLSLLLGSTFRGDGGFWGWDINQEFAVATRVLLQQHWIPIPQSPYNAMLSISVLPVVLSFLTKFSLTILFKLFYPLLCALIPLASYCLLMRFVRNSVAMPVVIIETIGSISYIQQMTALARQVVGLAFFIGILLVLFDSIWDRKKKIKIILLFTFGLSISHYSSAYLYSIIFVLAGLSSFFIRRVSFFRNKNLIPISTLRLGLTILIITLAWNGVFNNSAQDINTVSKNLVTKGPQFLPNKTGGLIDRWLRGVITSPESTPVEFKAAVLESNAYKYPNLQPQPVSLTYEIKPTNYPSSKPPLGIITGTLFYWLYIVINFIFQSLIVLQVLIAATLIFGLRSKKRRDVIDKTQSHSFAVLVDLIPLTFVSLLIALLIRTSGTGSTFYNPERAAFQLAFIFSLSIALLLEGFIKWTKRFQHVWSTALLLSSFIFLQSATSLIGYIYGSPSSRVSSTISVDGPFVISENEKSAANWIDQNTPKNSYLQSDVTANLVNSQKNVFGTKPFIAQTSPFGLFPGSYVYLSKSNLDSGITRQTVGGLTYIRVPFDYLDQNLSIVYSSGGARVYR